MSDELDLNKLSTDLSVGSLPKSSQEFIKTLLGEGMEIVRCKGDIDMSGYTINLDIAFTELTQPDFRIQILFLQNQRDIK